MHPRILRRRWLVNLLLMLVVTVLALLVLQENRREARAGRLTALEAAAVEHIERLRRGQSTLVLVRAEGRWRLREPFDAVADPRPVERLLGLVAAKSVRVLPLETVEPARLGLADPDVRLRLNGLELRFGDTEPIDGRRYVQIGDLVHLIEDRFLPQLLAPATTFLSRRLLPPDFSPGLGSIDGRPLSAGDLAGLADVEAESVEPLRGELTGRVLRIASADGRETLRFLVADGGTRWSRLDQRLSWRFRAPPLVEADEDAGRSPVPGAAGR
jgi:hypothetical protein